MLGGGLDMVIGGVSRQVYRGAFPSRWMSRPVFVLIGEIDFFVNMLLQ